MYVCINLYHCPHLAAVIVPVSLQGLKCSNWVRKLPSVIPCRLTSALLFICSCCSGRLMSAFMAAFKALIACSTMLRNGLYGGSFFSSELGPGMAGLLWADEPSWMKITYSFGSRVRLTCDRKSLNLCPFIPPRNAEWKMSPLVGEIASATITFLPRWPHTCRYALSPILARPWLLAVQILYPHSSTKILWFTTAWRMNQLA